MGRAHNLLNTLGEHGVRCESHLSSRAGEISLMRTGEKTIIVCSVKLRFFILLEV